VRAASPTTIVASDQRTARSTPATMRVRSTVGQSVNCVPTTASPTQPSTLRWAWASRMAR
jgi:hypothetical protein